MDVESELSKLKCSKRLQTMTKGFSEPPKLCSVFHGPCSKMERAESLLLMDLPSRNLLLVFLFDVQRVCKIGPLCTFSQLSSSSSISFAVKSLGIKNLRVTMSNPMTDGKNIPVAGWLFNVHNITKQTTCSPVKRLTLVLPSRLNGESRGNMLRSHNAPLILARKVFPFMTVRPK